MADLESVISGAIADAGGGGEADSSPDISGDEPVDNGGDNTPEVIENEGVTAPEVIDNKPAKEPVTPELGADGKPVEKSKVEEKPVAKTPEEEQLDKDLAELGIRPPKEGERENRLPHSRVKVMLGKYGAKLAERHAAVLTAKEAEYAPLRQKSEEIDNVDRLIVADPDRYIGILATLHPEKYGKFVGKAPAEVKPEVKPNEALTALGARPAPDAKFDDGSQGYTPEQHEKLLNWIEQKARIEAVAEAEDRMVKRFGPMEKAFQSVQARNQQLPVVRAQIAEVHQTWGKELVDKHENEIVALMEKNPKLTPMEAATRILVPATRADRTKLRTELLTEIEARPAAARKTANGAATAEKDEENSSSDPVENAIRKSVATLAGRR